MKIAVTGANGFVGSQMLKYYQDSLLDVLAIVRKGSDLSLLSGIPHSFVDYDEPSQLLQALEGTDILIHNAGKTKALNYPELFEANVLLTRKVIEAVNQSPSIKQFILISSQAASHPATAFQPARESDPPNPVTWYGKSKLRAEELVQKECRKAFTIIRPCSIYGEGDRDFLQLARLVSKGLELRIGKRERPLNMIYARDLASFIKLTFINPAAYSQVFFATDGEVYTQNQIVKAMLKAMQIKARTVVIPEALVRLVFTLGDWYARISRQASVLNRQKMLEALAPGWVCSIDKARELLGYYPQANFEEKIAETIKWYKKASWL